MALTDVKSMAELAALLGRQRAVVAHFWASWSEPCAHMDRVMAVLAADCPQAAFCRVEAEVAEDVTTAFDVTAVPLFVLWASGRVVGRLEGADPPALAAQVEHLLKLTAAAAPPPAASAAPAAIPAAPTSPAATAAPVSRERLVALIRAQPLMLFMKGTPETPRCGFSRKVASALTECGLPFGHFDILGDDGVRAGLKDFSAWPTYPQLYAGGEFVGGCDIVLEMQASGELKSTLEDMTKQQAAKADIAVAMDASG